MWKHCNCDPEPGRCADESVRRGRRQNVCGWVASGIPRQTQRLSIQRPSPAVSGMRRTTQLCQSGTSLWNRLRKRLSGRPPVLHRDVLWVAHLPLRPALHTIRFHGFPPNLWRRGLSYNRAGVSQPFLLVRYNQGWASKLWLWCIPSWSSPRKTSAAARRVPVGRPGSMSTAFPRRLTSTPVYPSPASLSPQPRSMSRFRCNCVPAMKDGGKAIATCSAPLYSHLSQSSTSSG